MKQLVIDTLKNNHTQKVSFMYVGSTGFVFRVLPGDFRTVALAVDVMYLQMQVPDMI